MQSYISFTSGIYYNNVEVDGILFYNIIKNYRGPRKF